MFGWFRKKAPPQTVEQQAVQSPVTRFQPNWHFTYEAKRLPGPGTQNYAYENLGLPEFTPIGATVANRMQLRSIAGPPAYAHFATYQAGVGGLVQGTIYGYPLITAGSTEGQITA